jgi:hypothetical protein
VANIRKPLFIKPLDLGTIATGNETAGYPASHLNRHKAIGLTWKSTGNSNVWARGQMTSAGTIDFAAIVSANALAGTQYRLRLGTSQAEVDGTAPYDSGVQTFISPSITREDGLYHSHLEMGAQVSATWWRIDITGHTGDFQAAALVLGRKIEPSHFYNYDHEYGAEDLGSGDFNRWGVFDEEPGIILRTVDFTLAWQSEAEYEASFRPLIETTGKRGFVYIAFDPEPSTYRQARTYMGVFGKVPFARGVRKGRTFTQDYQIRSII